MTDEGRFALLLEKEATTEGRALKGLSDGFKIYLCGFLYIEKFRNAVNIYLHWRMRFAVECN